MMRYWFSLINKSIKTISKAIVTESAMSKENSKIEDVHEKDDLALSQSVFFEFRMVAQEHVYNKKFSGLVL